MFGRIQAFSSIVGAQSYLMVVRGVFQEETRTRGATGAGTPLDEAAKRNIRDAWDRFMRPHLRG